MTLHSVDTPSGDSMIEHLPLFFTEHLRDETFLALQNPSSFSMLHSPVEVLINPLLMDEVLVPDSGSSNGARQ